MKSVMDPERTKKGRMQDIRAMRNYHVHFMVPELLDYMRRSGDPEVQQAMLEAFGWFTLSASRDEIDRKDFEMSRDE